MRDLLDRLRYGRARTLISSYIDGELSDRERRRVERHLSECAECRSELESLRLTAELVRGLPVIESSRSFALSAAPEAERGGLGFGWMAGTRMAAAVAAVLVIAVLAGAIGLLRLDAPDDPAPAMAPQTAAAPAAPAPAAAPVPEVAMAPAAQRQAAVPEMMSAMEMAADSDAPMPAAPAPAPTAAPVPAAPEMMKAMEMATDADAPTPLATATAIPSPTAAPTLTPTPAPTAMATATPTQTATPSAPEVVGDGMLGLPLVPIGVGALALVAVAWLVWRRLVHRI